MIKNVCFFGRYKILKDLPFDITEIGRKLAEKGYTIISGGFGGTMEQISKGAKQGGGKTIGITCYIFSDVGNLKVNKYVDEEIRTESLFERIEKMIHISDAFVVLPGGSGTLLEMTAILDHVNKGLVKFKPIICFGDYWKPVAKSVKNIGITNNLIKKQFNLKKCYELLHFVDSIDDLLDIINLYS
jgi:uncharacterized protein (TIGR00730 family)